MEKQQIYFEKQSLKMCGKHCLNNLFQDSIFTKEQLDKICEQLTPTGTFQINPHKSSIGLGNYDVNVIEKAIQEQNCELKWLDKRKKLQDQISFNDNKQLGLIVNYRHKQKLMGFIPHTGSHWISIRKIQGNIYVLNSFDKVPQEYDEEAIFVYLNEILQQNQENNIFIINRNDIK